MDDVPAAPGIGKANGNGAAPPEMPAAAIGHELPYVAPSSYLRPKPQSRIAMPESQPFGLLDRDQMQGLNGIREFLKIRTSYDVLPLSFRLIILDQDLLIKKSLNILIQNSIVSAPLWDSKNSTFAGLLTSTDYINVIQYYCQYPSRLDEVDQFRLSSLRKIEKAIGVIPPETISIHPMRPLYEACVRMNATRARRIPLIDVDDETGRETVVSVITQYRILKFIAVNNENYSQLLRKPVRECGLGTYDNIFTARMSHSVLDVINLMVSYSISSVPIVDKDNRVINVFEAVDVIPCIKGGVYDELTATVGEALARRSDDFPGIYTCFEDDRLSSIFDTLRKSRVHRFIVIDDQSHLKGIISLSDILKYVLGDEAEETDGSKDGRK
ncbi:hypothetical protein MCOR27_007139 [Pyricularia oryzae]|uniref:CBS domain-containing protein n=1 Tax=Pyricularia grisea TaxID=148305 RepID=A0ABQ8NZV9_PYRGI|nr:hypothetical protein MCOR01_003198 [Pyricularia oryzae]KAI6303513.1 hypothetical protein MCOR33_001395 [Pyricularia grisea]KAI6252207.1 hypothetical protein MCOR19_011177 [Pyricularia oryzae]KAI6270219.1 hypothetical protein MCOR26_008332 [Pyricularia oryzae]KAI6275043.1 hypothetical protein MCOR27_007139 [Pyricularia oryzae]